MPRPSHRPRLHYSNNTYTAPTTTTTTTYCIITFTSTTTTTTTPTATLVSFSNFTRIKEQAVRRELHDFCHEI
jgi:hypothetical protein